MCSPALRPAGTGQSHLLHQTPIPHPRKHGLQLGCTLGVIPGLWQLLCQLKGPSKISWGRECPGSCLVYLHKDNCTHSTLLWKCSMLHLSRQWWCAHRHAVLSSRTVLAHLSAPSQTYPGSGQTKAGFKPASPSALSITPQPGCLRAPPQPTSVIRVRGVQYHFKTRVFRKHRASQGAAEGRCITPAAASAALCPVSGGPLRSNTHYSYTGRSNQAGTRAQAPACGCPCCLVMGLLSPQAALAQAMPQHAAGATRARDFSR